MNSSSSKNEHGLTFTQGLEVDAKITTSATVQREISDRRYAPSLYAKATMAIVGMIVSGVIAAMLRVVLIK